MLCGFPKTVLCLVSAVTCCSGKIEDSAGLAYPLSMSAAQKRQPVTIETYLAEELKSQKKHEFLGGFLHAMAGGSNAHNLIATNVIGALHGRLRGKPCAAFNSDTKVRVFLPTSVRFYYPDASVVCLPNGGEDSFQDRPVVVVEVLSKSTRRIDQIEKKEGYLSIPTLSVYILIEQELSAVTVYRRSELGFGQEYYHAMDDVIPLTEIGAELPLAEIYERVEFVPEPVEE
ncbi:MAG: Uma2 family endonuclease [Pirellulales bacterium]|nr:Uma2 family endonuclease [Pirellulales bacterium]